VEGLYYRDQLHPTLIGTWIQNYLCKKKVLWRQKCRQDHIFITTSLAAEGQQNVLIPSFALGGGGTVPTKYGIGLAQVLVQTFWRTENVCSCTETNSRYPSHQLVTILCKYSLESHCRTKSVWQGPQQHYGRMAVFVHYSDIQNETVQLTGSPSSSDRWVHLQNHFYKTVITYRKKLKPSTGTWTSKFYQRNTALRTSFLWDVMQCRLVV
jgi:hypothetical protein